MSDRSGRPQRTTSMTPGSEPQAQPATEIDATLAARTVPDSRPRWQQSRARSTRSDLGQELEATIESCRELGPEYESLLVEAFLERLDRSLDERLVTQGGSAPAGQPTPQPAFTNEMVGAFALTLSLGIPLSAIGGEQAGLLAIWGALAVIWLGILGYFPCPKR